MRRREGDHGGIEPGAASAMLRGETDRAGAAARESLSRSASVRKKTGPPRCYPFIISRISREWNFLSVYFLRDASTFFPSSERISSVTLKLNSFSSGDVQM